MRDFSYKFDSGPVDTEQDLLDLFDFGNCRRAVQLYQFRRKDIFLKPEEILCPGAYNETGEFVVREEQEFSFDRLSTATSYTLKIFVMVTENLWTGENVHFRRETST